MTSFSWTNWNKLQWPIKKKVLPFPENEFALQVWSANILTVLCRSICLNQNATKLISTMITLRHAKCADHLSFRYLFQNFSAYDITSALNRNRRKYYDITNDIQIVNKLSFKSRFANFIIWYSSYVQAKSQFLNKIKILFISICLLSANGIIWAININLSK